MKKHAYTFAQLVFPHDLCLPRLNSFQLTENMKKRENEESNLPH